MLPRNYKNRNGTAFGAFFWNRMAKHGTCERPAFWNGTRRHGTDHETELNGTERKRPYLDNEELPEALDWTNRILPVRSSFLAWFKKKLNIARGRQGGLGGGAPQAHSWLICKFCLERTGTEYVERPSSVSVWTPFVMERVAIWNGLEQNGTPIP